MTVRVVPLHPIVALELVTEDVEIALAAHGEAPGGILGWATVVGRGFRIDGLPIRRGEHGEGEVAWPGRPADAERAPSLRDLEIAVLDACRTAMGKPS